MDYEKKYRDLVEAVKELQEANPSDDGIQKWVEDNVPELKESEDEESKKWILEYLYDGLRKSGEDEQFKNQFKAAIAWFEKQRNKDMLIKELGEYKVKYTQEVLENIKGSFTYWTNAHDFRPKHLQRCICYDKYMKGVYCYVYDDISKYWCTQTTEEHDPDGDNHICDYADYRVTMWMPLPDTSFDSSKSLCENQDKQKPDDKVKPKFNVGNIIKHNKANIICKVLSANVGFYRLMNILGGDEIELSNVEKNFHLWTIQDAKDGDVLAFDDDTIVIFKNLYNKTSFHSYCHIEEGIFETSKDDNPDWWDAAGFYPATKEQRNLLYQMMADAGYEWDEENKKVKKIEQKPTWSKEDEDILNTIIYTVKNKNCIGVPNEIMVNWLKSLKDKYTWKPSEKQMNALDSTVQYGKVSRFQYEHLNSLFNDLKKLRGD